MPAYPLPKGDSHPRQVQAVGTLLKMLGNYSRKQIVWALSIIPEAYGDMRVQMRAGIIKALAEFIKQHPETNRARMVAELEQIEVEGLEKDARSYVGIRGGTTTAAMIEALERLYKNAGRKRSAG